jgi:hypothetical protein
MKNRTRYVYYDKSGNISHILATRRRGRAKYITCDIDEVIGMLNGSEGINNYIVAYNLKDEQYQLLKRDNIIRFRKKSDELYKIPYRKNVEADIRITYFKDNVIEVTLDLSRVSPLYQTNFKEDVKFEKGTEFRFVLKEKDSGNLVKEIVIDGQELLNSGQLFFELYDHIKSDNVEFFTYKLFDTYCWQKGSEKLCSPLKDQIKFDIHKADRKRRSGGFEYHLDITANKKQLKIKNNIESLDLIRFHKKIEFFVVDNHDPNILYDKFDLVADDLKNGMFLVDLKVDMTDKTLLYNHKYISVLLNELSKIPYQENIESDVRITFFENNVLGITLDLSKKENVTFKKEAEFRLVLKEEDSGNLLKEIVLEAQELVDSEQLFFDLYDHIKPDNVEFFTYKLFDTYCWQVVKERKNLEPPIKFEINKADRKSRSDGFEYHLVITSIKKQLTIENNIGSLKPIKFYKAVEFFVVDKYDPSILYDKFYLDDDDFKNEVVIVDLKVDISDKTLLYNHKHINVLLN